MCKCFLNALTWTIHGGVCVFELLQGVLDVEVFAFLNTSKYTGRESVSNFFMLQCLLDVEALQLWSTLFIKSAYIL